MKPNLVLWLLGGSGVFFLYCAVANKNPSTLIQSYFDPSVTPTSLTGVGGNDGTKSKNGVVDPKSRGDAGPLLDPNNPNNLFPNGVNGSSATYITPNGQVAAYPKAYASAPGTYIQPKYSNA